MSSDNTTIARPYAKAIFESALANNTLGQWSAILNNLAWSILEPQVLRFITNPAVTQAQQVELLMVTFRQQQDKQQPIKNLLLMLAHYRRLPLLVDIKLSFEALRAEQEKTLDVKVLSFTELTAAQQQQLIDSLSKRLNRKVVLSIEIDKSLKGGAVIQAGDLIIDGSVQDKLTKLTAELAA